MLNGGHDLLTNLAKASMTGINNPGRDMADKVRLSSAGTYVMGYFHFGYTCLIRFCTEQADKSTYGRP